MLEAYFFMLSGESIHIRNFCFYRALWWSQVTGL